MIEGHHDCWQGVRFCRSLPPPSFRLAAKHTGVDLSPTERKTIDLEGRIVKDGVRKVIRDRQQFLFDLVHAIAEYRKRQGE
jgi:hypothetical protein